MKLVDASFLIDYARRDESAISYLAAHEEAVIGASAIVLSELYRGLILTQGYDPGGGDGEVRVGRTSEENSQIREQQKPPRYT
ncbi:MAG: hypothetical protein U5K37_01845 [Natrialbaceae archaeon]|nr:hypothetical protein [Natrialbaceae archaeon]